MIDGLIEERDVAPLHVAVKRGLTDGVEILLKYNADLNVQSQDGYTPLMMACAVSWCNTYPWGLFILILCPPSI